MMIKCRVCKQEKEEKEFHPSSLKKRDWICKLCKNASFEAYHLAHPERMKSKARERVRKYRETHRELERERNKKYREQRKIYSREYYKKNLKIKQAQQKARYAQRDGVLTPYPCVMCGSPIVEKHHEDYSKPLEIIWFCTKHHRRHHKWIE